MARALSGIIVTVEFDDGNFVTTRQHEMATGVADPDALAESLAVAYEGVSGSAIKRIIVSKAFTDPAIAGTSLVTRMAKLSVNHDTPGKKSAFFIPGVLDTTDVPTNNNPLVTGRNINLNNPELLTLLGLFQSGTQMLLSDGEALNNANLIADGELVTRKSNTRKI